MSQIETIPGFRCLEYKWQVQEQIYEEIKDMTPEEEIAYFRRAAETGPLAELWKRIGARQDSGASPNQSSADHAGQ